MIRLWYKLKDFSPKRSLIFYIQRKMRGWDDSDTWSLDFAFGKFIHPRLIRFKEVNCGRPEGLTEEEWDDILQEMIDGFEVMANEERYWGINGKNGLWVNDLNKAQRSMDLFHEWYRDLWW